MKTIFYTILTTFLFLSMSACKGKKEIDSEKNTKPILVTINSKSLKNTATILNSSGKIEAIETATISTKMMGFVKNVSVEIGDSVKKGQLLISIENKDLIAKKRQIEAGISKATAAFKNAKKDFERFTNLFAKQSASQKELDDVTTQYKMAKAHLETANQMKNEINAHLLYTNIKAPFNGIVTDKFIKKGTLANPGMPLLAIENPKYFQVIAKIPESEISQIKLNAEIPILIKSLQKTVKGKVTAISSSAKNTGGQFLVKVLLEKTEVPILSGMFVNLKFPIPNNTKISSLLIPKNVLITKGELKGIYTISQNNTAILRWLRLGKTYGKNVEVLAGLKDNENYIIAAQGKLYNGAKITIQ